MKDFNHDYATLYENCLLQFNKLTNEKGLDLIYEAVFHTIHEINRKSITSTHARTLKKDMNF